MERQLTVCDNDTRPDAKAVQKRKLIMSVGAACSKGITGETHVILFVFPGFAVKYQSYIDMAKQIPI